MSDEIGLSLVKQSLSILRREKKLFIFSIMSTLLTFATLIAAIIPLTEIESAAWKKGGAVSFKTFCIFFAILFACFLIMNVTALLCAAALIACGLKKLKGEPWTLADGFRAMGKNFYKLYRWQSTGNILGTGIRLYAYWADDWKEKRVYKTLLAGQRWAIAITLIIPVIVAEELKPYDALERSAALMQKTWGEGSKTLTSYIRYTGKLFLLRILILLPALIGFLLGDKTLLIIGTIISAASFITITIINNAAQIFFIAALYLFAIGVDISQYYDSAMLKKAFQPRNTVAN